MHKISPKLDFNFKAVFTRNKWTNENNNYVNFDKHLDYVYTVLFKIRAPLKIFLEKNA